MVGDEVAPADIVVVDTDRAALERAKSAGLVTVHGERHRVRRAAAGRRAARQVDHRRHQPRRHRGARHADRARAGAQGQDHRRRSARPRTSTCCSNPARTRWWCPRRRQAGCSASPSTTPSVVEMIEDLLTPDAGFAIAEREVEAKEVGGSPRHLPDIVLGVVRDGQLLRVDAPEVDALEAQRPAALHPHRRQRPMSRRQGSFQLRNVPLLSRVGADRADHAAHRHRRRGRRMGGCRCCCGWIRATRC